MQTSQQTEAQTIREKGFRQGLIFPYPLILIAFFYMYERKITEDLDCGIVVTMKVLGGKWKACIIDSISKGIKRPSDLHRLIPTASPRVLNMQLAELHNHGVINKKIYAELPLRVEYNLTEFGKSLLPIIQVIDTWGTSNRAKLEITTSTTN